MYFRPSSPLQIPVPFVQQQKPGDCLAACVAMLCGYWKRSIAYDALTRRLEIQTNVGGLLENVRYLEPFGFSVYYRRRSTLSDLYRMLENGWPPIVGVQAKELPYWQDPPSQHAVLVVGMTESEILVNDPAAADAPTSVPIGDFDLAWLEMDEAFAVIVPEL